MKNVLERLKEEMDETSDIMPTVTVSRKDLTLLIKLYEDLLKHADLDKL